MSRKARIVIPGRPHHVSQRGNNREAVFFSDQDREVYLGLLGEQARRYDLRIEGYCLMEDHVHVVATPASEESLNRALGTTGQFYSQYVNYHHGRSGHLWQDRFSSCALDNEWFWRVLVYVECCPVRGGLVRGAWRDDLKEAVSEEVAARIRLHTRTGRPLGSEAFVLKLERALGQRLRALPVGRPRKDGGRHPEK